MPSKRVLDIEIFLVSGFKFAPIFVIRFKPTPCLP